jgi:hypothetical protein
MFLLEQFRTIYKQHQVTTSTTDKPPPAKKRRIKKNPMPTTYDLPTLGKLDSTCLPAGYSTPFPPSPNGCDDCDKTFDISDVGIVLICGHGYHKRCYDKMESKCRICLEHFKAQIWDNVNSFLKRLNGDWNTLTSEDLNEDEQTNDDDGEEDETAEEVVSNLNMDKRSNLISVLNKKISEIQIW